MTLLASFQALLARYTGQEDIVVGSPIAGRIHKEVEGLIGFFVNSLVLRTDLGGDPSFRHLLARVRDVCQGAFAHQDLPFEKLVEEIQPQRDLSREAVFQVMFQLQNAPLPEARLSQELTVSPVEAPSGATRFDLEVYIREQSGRLFANLIYSTDIFERSTIERLAQHFELLLAGLVEDPGRPISEIPLLTGRERRVLLEEVNDTVRVPVSGRAIHELFEAQVARAPQAVALEFGGREMSYAELNARANQLACALRARGVGPEVLVPICLERGIDFIVGVVGIVKAGGAYVPIDPSYPRARLEFLLHDAAGPVLITNQPLQAKLPPGPREILCIDDASLAELPDGNLISLTKPDTLAYIIYTSGSTGRPKGVGVEQAAIERLVIRANYIDITPADRVAQASTTTFDAATFEIWGALLNGATLVGVPKDVMLVPGNSREHLADRRISTLFVTIGALQRCRAK